MDEIEELVRRLNLAPHPEGGYFRETYRSAEHITLARYDGPRATSTAIYFLVTAESPSRLHRVKSDEIWHFYAGDALEMLQLHEDGAVETFTIGSSIRSGEVPQVLVPKGSWQGVRVVPGGRYGLVGATVAPGFDFNDFEMAERDSLLHHHPSHAELITALT